jgi:hypothetical protein
MGDVKSTGTPTTHRGRGRPRLPIPNVRLECMLPKAALDELVKREAASGQYRTRIAASILCEQLIGGDVHSYYPQS